ncbi:MAG: preprotein translocase subunit SecG [Rubricoccaceae bacterium]
MLFTLFIVLILLVAVLITLVVLLQSGQGGGLAGIASGGQTQQILGARQAPDFLEKATWTLGSAFLALCIVASFFHGSLNDEQRSILQQRGVVELPAGVPPVEAPQTNPVSPFQPGEQAEQAPSSETPVAPAPAPVQPAQ